MKILFLMIGISLLIRTKLYSEDFETEETSAPESMKINEKLRAEWMKLVIVNKNKNKNKNGNFNQNAVWT